jgi:hypothetical protein
LLKWPNYTPHAAESAGNMMLGDLSGFPVQAGFYLTLAFYFDMKNILQYIYGK